MLTNKGNFILTNEDLTVFYDNKNLSFNKESENFQEALALVREDRYAEIFEKFVVSSKTLLNYSEGHICVKEGQVLIDGETIDPFISTAIVEYMNAGLDYKRLIRFAQRCAQNPNQESVEGLFSFLSTGSYPITEAGTFIAYKVIRPDFKDIYTGTIDNSVGAVVTMPREKVTFDRNVTCSQGLHFSSINYCTTCYGRAGNGDIVVNLEICPSKVVSIPLDYKNQKGRCCEYKVLGVNESQTELLVNSSFSIGEYGSYDDETPYIKFTIDGEVKYVPAYLFDIESDEDPSELLERNSLEWIVEVLQDHFEDDRIKDCKIDLRKFYDATGLDYISPVDFDEDDYEDDYVEEDYEDTELKEMPYEDKVNVELAAPAVAPTRGNFLSIFKFWK